MYKFESWHLKKACMAFKLNGWEFRNTNMSTLSGLRPALFFVTIFPEVEISISLRRHRRSKDAQQLSRYFWQSGKSLCICFLAFQGIGVRIKRRKWSSSSLLVLIDSFSERVPKRKCMALSFIELSLLLVGGPLASVYTLLSLYLPCLHRSQEIPFG